MTRGLMPATQRGRGGASARLVSVRLGSLRTLGARGTSARISSALLIAAVAVWSAVMVAWFLDAITLPLSSRAIDVVLAAPAVLLALTWATSERPAEPSLRVATGWTTVVAAVLLLSPQLVANPSLAFALPGVLALTWVVYTRPTVGAAALIAITASFGSLTAYFSFPYKRAITVLLFGLWIAAIVRLLLRRREQPFAIPLAGLVALAYPFISVVQVVLSGDRSAALGGFELAPWYMLTMFAVAYSQWSAGTDRRVMKAVLWIALGVGAYATLRLIIGPSSVERALAARSQYNFVGTKQKLLGSFVSGPDLAEWTALMIPFCASCALGLRGRTRLLAWATLPLLTIALFGSQVRAPAVAVSLSVLLVASLHTRPRAFAGNRLGMTATAIAAMVAIVIGAYAVSGSSKSSGHSYLALLTADTHDVSVSEHKYKWGLAFRDLAGHPFGYGLGTAPAGYTSNVAPSPYLLPVTGFSADNGFLKIALEQGFAVMVVFAAGLLALVVALAKRGVSARDPVRATIALGAAGTAASFLVLEGAGAFADGIPAIMGWLVIGLGYAQVVQRSPRLP